MNINMNGFESIGYCTNNINGMPEVNFNRDRFMLKSKKVAIEFDGGNWLYVGTDKLASKKDEAVAYEVILSSSTFLKAYERKVQYAINLYLQIS